MASDEDIARGVEALLRQIDPSSVTTLNDVVHQLEANLGVHLSDRAGFIREQINLILRAHPQPPPPPPQHHHQQTHFAPHHHQQFPSHFAHYPFHHDLNFSHPQPDLPPPLHLHPEALPRNAAAPATVMPKASAPAGAKRKGGPGGLNKVCGVSPELQVIVGEPALPRTEIVKQLWAYIRKHNLQDPSNKRKIICDDALRVVFETDCTDMFKMNKLLSKHIIRLEPTKESTSQAKRSKVDAECTTESTELAQSPASSPVIISEALAKFLGVGERQMLQSEAIRQVWEYIKSNLLEDPLNPMVILCDANLHELLRCESISALGIPEMLARYHILKQCASQKFDERSTSFGL